jgi:hypothetical protein
MNLTRTYVSYVVAVVVVGVVELAVAVVVADDDVGCDTVVAVIADALGDVAVAGGGIVA